MLSAAKILPERLLGSKRPRAAFLLNQSKIGLGTQEPRSVEFEQPTIGIGKHLRLSLTNKYSAPCGSGD